jgi:hypothetical protein
MASFKASRILMAGTACMLLASCDGADSVASPGEGSFPVVPAPAPTASPTGTPTTPGTPAASCPTGFADGGVVGAFRACRLPRVISSDLTLRKLTGVAYEINGQVDVGIDVGGNGQRQGGTPATLTVEPGVIVYANTDNATNDFLIVNRGSRMNAIGTATQPIIFTAQGNLTGTVTDESQGLWGGIIMAGRAPISNCNQTVAGGSVGCENIVEGTTTALYGGATADDNSGTVRYVQIRYSGTVISTNNELQGLTLGGTGSGTTIDHVQIHNSSDDGIEIFGGRTNLKYLAMTGADDDAFDTDVGWQGYAQFVLAVQKPNSTQTDNYATEIDSNNNEDALPRQRYNIANFTFVSTTAATNAVIRLRGGADARFLNGIVTGPTACLNIVAGLDSQGKSTIRPANATLDDLGAPVFNSVVMSCANPFAATPVNDVTVTVAEQEAIFNAGTNNVARATGIVTNGYLPAGVALTTTAFAAATINPFFVNTNFIGAVSGPNDTSFAGWTCNSNRASFGSTSGSCTALPTG